MTYIATALARLHAYIFYVLRKTCKAAFDDGWEDWKALLFISVTMNFAAMTAVAVISIGLGHAASTEHFLALWGLIVCGLIVVNYYSLMAHHRWSRFEREFRHQSKAMRVFGAVAVWVGVTLFCVAAPWTMKIAAHLPPR